VIGLKNQFEAKILECVHLKHVLRQLTSMSSASERKSVKAHTKMRDRQEMVNAYLRLILVRKVRVNVFSANSMFLIRFHAYL
jgi:hypothetical protein